jgi:glycosyltransferase involved in cell wall biosynthesis
MIKIVHCINGLDVGGAEMMLFRTVTHMPRERISSLVVSVMSVGAMGERIQQAGIPVVALGKTPGKPDPRMVWKLYWLLRREKPDIVQTHMYEANLYGLLAAKLARVPVIWGIRCSDMDFSSYRPLSRLSFSLGRLFSGLPDVTVVNSEAGRKYHIERGYDGKRMIVIPNGFELGRFRPDLEQHRSFRAELGIGDDVLLVGHVARFDAMKDYATLMQAAGIAAQRDPSARFVLVGDQVTMENAGLARWIHNAGIESRIHLLGHRSDIPRIMAGLDVFVSSSISEGFPNVVGEAMACGVPCVVTDVGDSAFLVGDTGRVVPAKDPNTLADAIFELLAMAPEERTRLGQAARRLVEENFEIGKVTRRLEQLYESVIAGKRSITCAA